MFGLFKTKRTIVPPVRTFTGWLKCHRPTREDPTSEFVLANAFPTFAGSETPPPLSPIQKAGFDVARELGIQIVDVSSGKPRRRFAGDIAGLRTLDRGCYYSVCRNGQGSDRGTLAHELNSYLKPDETGFAFCLPGDDSQNVVFYAADAPDCPSRIVAKAKELQYVRKEKRQFKATLSCKVDEVTIENVLDLRYEDARDWLFKTFGNGDGDWLEYRGRPIPQDVGFWGIFSTLMDIRAGGNDFTDIVASCLISKGVAALIFPSARSNAHVHFENGQLVDCSGWNLVDWRNAPSPVKRKLVWLTDWNPPPAGGVRVRIAPHNSKFRGSFTVENIEEHHRWMLHVIFLFGIFERHGDTGQQFAYRWHSGRMFSPKKAYEAQCAKCNEKTLFEKLALQDMPPSCPACGFDQIELPRMFV